MVSELKSVSKAWAERLASRRQAPDHDGFDEAKKALEAASARSQSLWLGFISFSAYYVISIGAVTHRNLFLEDPIKLPILGIELPLVAYFWVAPALFVIFHAYLFMHLRFLAINARQYRKREWSQGNKKAKDVLRLHLPNFVMIKLIAGAREHMKGVMGLAVRAAAINTLIFGPIVILLITQLQFLPYHSELTTWFHRILIAADLGLIWLFWPRIRILRQPKVSDRQFLMRNMKTRPLLALLSLSILAFSCLIAVFPTETIAGTFFRTPNIFCMIARAVEPEKLCEQKTIAFPNILTKSLFEGAVNEVTGRRNSLGQNTLVLSDIDFVSLTEKELKEVETTVSLRGRRLEGAVLARTDLRKANFTGAKMKGADFSWAQLQGANLRSGFEVGCRIDQNGKLSRACTDLTDAKLEGTKLRNAVLDDAILNNADLSGAELQEASLKRAKLNGASFLPFQPPMYAQGPSQVTQLQGAMFHDAELIGADFRSAKLQGASFFIADLRAVRFDHADLRSADFASADLRGVSMTEAQVQGAVLNNADLQGADLRGANFEGASLEEVILKGARSAGKPEFGSESGEDFNPYLFLHAVFEKEELGSISWSVDDYKKFVNQTLELIADESSKKTARRYLSALDPATASPDATTSDEWSDIRKLTAKSASPDFAKMSTTWINKAWWGRIDFLLNLVCFPLGEDARYQVQGIFDNGSIYRAYLYRTALSQEFLNTKKCPGAALLNEKAKLQLSMWALENLTCALPLPGNEADFEFDKDCDDPDYPSASSNSGSALNKSATSP